MIMQIVVFEVGNKFINRINTLENFTKNIRLLTYF